MTAENTKQNIINAAGELAAELGFTNVSTRQVADRSGQNIGSIHYHFGGKDGLFEAVVREAMGSCCHKGVEEALSSLCESTSREELSHMVRVIIESEITDIFRSERPEWHVPVIYQLLQRDDFLYDLFHDEVVATSAEAMERFFKTINPEMDDQDIHLHKVLMKMPIYAHADYRKVMLKMLNEDQYSEDYLLRMEDMLVKQTQLLLGLPLDK